MKHGDVWRFCLVSVVGLSAGYVGGSCCEGGEGEERSGVDGCVHVAECFSPEKATELRDKCAKVANGLPYIPIACEESADPPNVCRFHDSFDSETCNGEHVRVACCREAPAL